MNDGVYEVSYYGPFGSGNGTFHVCNGVVLGIDVGGGKYSGTVIRDESTGKNLLWLNLQAPSNAPLVTDGRYQRAGAIIPIKVEFTDDDLGKQLALTLPTGLVTIRINYVSDKLN